MQKTCRTWVRSLGWEDPLEEEMTTHSSTLAWKISWTEERGRLQSMGSQRIGHDWAISLSLSLQQEKNIKNKENWNRILTFANNKHDNKQLARNFHEKVKMLVAQSCPTLCNPWTVARQAPLSIAFSRQEYCSGLPFPPPGDLLDSGIKPTSLTSPELTGRFFSTSTTWETCEYLCTALKSCCEVCWICDF